MLTTYESMAIQGSCVTNRRNRRIDGYFDGLRPIYFARSVEQIPRVGPRGPFHRRTRPSCRAPKVFGSVLDTLVAIIGESSGLQPFDIGRTLLDPLPDILSSCGVFLSRVTRPPSEPAPPSSSSCSGFGGGKFCFSSCERIAQVRETRFNDLNRESKSRNAKPAPHLQRGRGGLVRFARIPGGIRRHVMDSIFKRLASSVNLWRP